MGHSVSARKTHAAIMSARLGDFVDCVLVVGCGRCWDRRSVVVLHLMDRYGGQRKMVKVIDRLLCSVPRCGWPPRYVALRYRRTNTEIVLVGPGAYS
jgi:hypothetical protein